jgi:hypothetical protein
VGGGVEVSAEVSEILSHVLSLNYPTDGGARGGAAPCAVLYPDARILTWFVFRDKNGYNCCV